MATRLVRGLGCAALLLGLSLPAPAQTAPRFRVQVTVHADSPEIVSQVTASAGRALRALGDVEVVDTLADYTLHFSVARVTVGGKLGGYAVSMAVTQWVDRYNCFLGTQLQVVNLTRGLRQATAAFVASFDANMLRDRRRAVISRTR